MANATMFIANMPMTATPRTMSSVTMRGCGVAVAVIASPLWEANLLLRRLRLKLDVVLEAHAADHLELGLEEVDMTLLGLENLGD